MNVEMKAIVGFTHQRNAMASRDFIHELAKAVLIAKNNNSKIGTFFIDIDHLNGPIQVADSHVLEGILDEVERRLASCIESRGQISRYDKDQFIAYAMDVRDVADITALATRIQHVISQPIHDVRGIGRIFLTVSIGATLYPDDDSKPRDLLFHAYKGMRQAQLLGGATHKIFDYEQMRASLISDRISAALLRALKHGRIRLQYQPKVDLTTGVPVGAEALVRWHDSDGQLINPNDFLPHIQLRDCMLVLDLYVLETAIRQAVRWSKEGVTPILSVNISPNHFNQPNFGDSILEILQRTPEFDPKFLAIEILETLAIEKPFVAKQIFSRLREIGIKIYLDDFGTGRSSAAYLKMFPVDAIKIDKTFIMDLPFGANSDKDRAIIQASISVARAFGVYVIAEGIETYDAAKELIRMGCTNGQGYLFSRPMNPEQFMKWYADAMEKPFRFV